MTDAFGVDREAIFKADSTKRQKRTSQAMVGVGSAGIAAGANQNRIAQVAGTHRLKNQMAAKLVAEHDVAALKSVKKPKPAGTWAAAGKPQGVGSGAARRAAHAGHYKAVKEASGRVDAANRAIKQVPKFQRAVAERTLIGGVAVGAPLVYAGARRMAAKNKVSKKINQKDIDSGAVGATGAAAAYHGAGYGSKPYEKKKINTKINADPAAKQKFEQHKQQYGIKPNHPAGSPEWKKMFRNYPKDLPGAKLKRTMGYTHSGTTGMVVQGGLVAGGTALAIHQARKRPVKKGYSNAPLAHYLGHSGNSLRSGIPDAGTSVVKNAANLNSKQNLRRRKNIQAGLAITGSTIGLTALAARGGKSLVPKVVKVEAKAKKISSVLDRHTDNALVAGAGIGGVAGFNSASISRQEAKALPKKIKKSAFGVNHS